MSTLFFNFCNLFFGFFPRLNIVLRTGYNTQYVDATFIKGRVSAPALFTRIQINIVIGLS